MKQFDVVALGELLVDFTRNGESGQGNPLFEANPGGAPANVLAMLQNAGLSIALDVIGVVIAALFLISDFSLIQNCVEQSYPKEYEWAAAFGLVFTVTWVYLKILDLLMRMANRS